jgi:hypothetical protein
VRQQKIEKPSRMSTRNFPIPAWLKHEHAIIEALERIEQARDAMQTAAEQLTTLIEQDPRDEWQERWQRFINAGGVTVDEFCRWLVHDSQIRRTKQRKHLRLIASNTPPHLVPMKLKSGDRDNKNKTSIPRARSRRPAQD